MTLITTRDKNKKKNGNNKKNLKLQDKENMKDINKNFLERLKRKTFNKFFKPFLVF